MAMSLIESREASRGVKIIHPRERSGDVAVVFAGKAFLENRDYLVDLNVDFASRNVGWSKEAARPFYFTELNIDQLTSGRPLTPEIIDMIAQDGRKAVQIPSTILVRKEYAAPGDYFALSSGRTFFIQTREGEKPAFYHILRSIDSRFRGRHRGRILVELELLTHRLAEAYVHRSANPMALYTNTKSESLDFEGNHPIKSPFTEGSVEYAITKQVMELTTEGHHELGLDGVIRRLYKQPNTSFIPDPTYERTWNFYKRMIAEVEEGGFNMDLEGGDTMMSYYPIK